jgi:mitofusin
MITNGRLGKGIEDTSYLLGNLINQNTESWPFRYPNLHFVDKAEASSRARPGMSKRTMTFANDPTTTRSVTLNSAPAPRSTMKRSLTMAPEPHPEAATTVDDQVFSTLKLDLNMGAAKSGKAIIEKLQEGSIAKLLNEKFTTALDHLAALQKRVHDPQSRVLVTGDLNAGKSTLVNALLRRSEFMPTDEQPLTTRFVEVISAKENEDKEEIHVLDQETKYDVTDKSTYTTETIDKLDDLINDESADATSPPLRVFLKNMDSALAHPTILHNGVVDISLIDAPGLNRDCIKTTANFARQEEIDVVVFVVSAANHFTLSAKEFIWQASHEKAHLFIVVNRFDQIKDKAKCRRIVMEQIKQMSPESYEEAKDLVHFVDSAKVAMGCSDGEDAEEMDQAFAHLEQSLRSFVLVNRSKSKLGPAQNYVTHLLADIEVLASANSLVSTEKRDAARAHIDSIKPVLNELQKCSQSLEDTLMTVEEEVSAKASKRSQTAMETALSRVGRGELAAPAPGLSMPEYPGVLGAFDYAKALRQVYLASLDFAIGLAEQDTRQLTSEGVDQILAIADKNLPSDVERSTRVFNANAMFTRTTPKLNRRQSGVQAVGLSLATQGQLVEVNLSDIFDIQHHIFIARSHLPSSEASSSRARIPHIPEMTGVGAASLAVGAFTFGGKALGINTLIDSMIRVSDLASNPLTRKWIGPVIGVCTLGAVAYVVYELPRSIPRNVGRSLQSTLLASSGTTGDNELVPFTEYHAGRMGKESRKVMRLISWDTRERFRGAVSQRLDAVKESEKTEKRAKEAIEFFAGVETKVGEIRETVGVKV